jgi:hypothetical protein
MKDISKYNHASFSRSRDRQGGRKHLKATEPVASGLHNCNRKTCDRLSGTTGGCGDGTNNGDETTDEDSPQRGWEKEEQKTDYVRNGVLYKQLIIMKHA